MNKMDEMLHQTKSLNWKNIQEPIQQVILSLVQVTDANTNQVKELAENQEDFVTLPTLRRVITESFSRCCTKTDAAKLMEEIENKASKSSVEAKLEKSLERIDLLEQKVESFTKTIDKLVQRIELQQKEITDLRLYPQLDPLYKHVDTAVNNIRVEVDRKLNAKADVEYVQHYIPNKLDDMYRSLNVQVCALKNENKLLASKEEVKLLLNRTASLEEVKDINATVMQKAGKQELHHEIVSQVKPLIAAVSSIEKTVQMQSTMYDSKFIAAEGRITKLINQLEQQEQQQLSPENNLLEKSKVLQSENSISNKVDSIIKERHLVEELSLEEKLATKTDYILKQMSLQCEATRMEIVATQREEISTLKSRLKSRFDDINKSISELNQTSLNTRKAIRELSHKTNSSLDKKLEIKDFKKLMKIVGKNADLYAALRDISNKKSDGKLVNDVKSVISEHLDPIVVDTSKDSRDVTRSVEENSDLDSLLKSMNLNNDSNEDEESEEEMEEIQETNRDIRIQEQKRSNTTLPERKSKKLSTRSKAYDNPDQNKASVPIHLLSEKLRKYATIIETTQQQVGRVEKDVENFQQQLKNLTQAVEEQIIKKGSVLLSQRETDQKSQVDWNFTIGDLGSNLRREIAEKTSREEMTALVHSESDKIQAKLSHFSKLMEETAKKEDYISLNAEFNGLRSRIAGELTGARFLWTSGTLLNDNFVPWDKQVVNAAPSSIVWKKSSHHIGIKIPGLYRLYIAMFTHKPSALQVYLNDEPILMIQPHGSKADNTMSVNGSIDPNPYSLRRFKHSVGEVTSIHIDETVSLPPDAAISVRYFSSNPAQGFIAIRKV